MPAALPAAAVLALALISTSTETPDVERFVQEALEAHPEIVTARRRALSARRRVAPAGSWDDPTLDLGVLNLPYDPLSLNATPMTGIRVGLSQRIPWPGKRRLAEDAARAGAAAAEQQLEEARNQLAAEVRTLYFDVHFLDVSTAVLRTNLATFDRFIQVADAKYRVGKGRQQNVLRARVARDELQEELLGVERARAATVERLRFLLARNGPLEIPALLDVPVSKLRPGLSEAELVERADRSRPGLRALAYAQQGAGARAALADKAAWPDLGVSFSYTFRGDAGGRDPADGADFLSLGLSVGLPVFYGRKQGPTAEAARADHAAAASEMATARLEIRGVIGRVLAEVPRLERQMQKYATDIIPTTAQALEADLIAYRVDKVDFLDLLDIEMRLVRFQIDYHRLHVVHEKLIVQLARTLGDRPRDLVVPGEANHVHGAHP